MNKIFLYTQRKNIYKKRKQTKISNINIVYSHLMQFIWTKWAVDKDRNWGLKSFFEGGATTHGIDVLKRRNTWREARICAVCAAFGSSVLLKCFNVLPQPWEWLMEAHKNSSYIPKNEWAYIRKRKKCARLLFNNVLQCSVCCILIYKRYVAYVGIYVILKHFLLVFTLYFFFSFYSLCIFPSFHSLKFFKLFQLYLFYYTL